MKHYVPFLKMKQNEIGAISELHSDIRLGITPFFDVPRPKESTRATIQERIRIAKKFADAELSSTEFYLDNFDLDDSISLDTRHQYETVLDIFSSHKIIAVTALNRNPLHNEAAINFSGKRNTRIALRLTAEDLESYRISKPELDNLYANFILSGIDTVDVIFDFRVIGTSIEDLAENAIDFLAQIEKNHFASKIIIAGSSIPASVRDLLKTKEETLVDRKEWALWNLINSKNDDSGRLFIFGDYGVVSPDYTDMEMDFAIIQNIAAPKIFYTFKDKYFLIRGGSFKTHPAKYGQYFTMADTLVDKAFFRKKTFSFGEKYIFDRCYQAKPKAKKGGSPGSWLKATLCTHMTFVFNSI